MNSSSRRPRSRRALGSLLAAVALIVSVFAPTPASAEFDVTTFDVLFHGEDATPGYPLDDPTAHQAGSHPFAVTTIVGIDYTEEGFAFVASGDFKDLIIKQAAGLVGDATAVPQCSTADFLTRERGGRMTLCDYSAAVGVVGVNLLVPAPLAYFNAPVYNVEPPPGSVVRLGFVVLGVPVLVDVGIEEGGENRVVAAAKNTPQPLTVFGSALQLWGVPSDPAHDPIRANCLGTQETSISEGGINFMIESNGKCPSNAPEKPFLTVPRSCTGPATTSYKADAWDAPGVWDEGSVVTHDSSLPPIPEGFTGCGKLNFAPEISSSLTTQSAETGSGIDFNLDINDQGLTSIDGLAGSDAKKAVVTLPEGVTVNPSIGEGLGVCTPTDLSRETLSASPGEGCPNGSKIGTVHIESPLVDESFEGSVFLAQQDDPATTTPGAENPFDTLISFYIVVRNPKLGILVKLPAKVEPDPKTGRLVVTADDVPQLPFNHFNLHFREGQRAALVSPPACGTYTTEAKLYPWSDPDNPRTVTSSFEITEGVGGGPCPPGGVPPFKPEYEAGSINNNAASHTSFNMRLIRHDGEQDMTKFSSVLPPGVVGKLAGLDKCSDAAAEAAKLKTGREELASPSCPANSQIGRSLAGAGVGGALTYVGGQIYLGGPYKGAPLSVISITPAVAGPFDAGTVVVRLGLDLNSETAEVEVDGAASDPIPHILKGIPLKVRDLRVYVDRQNFILNPTSCDPSSAKATLFGGYLDVFSPADDVPVDLASRFQAANCLNLPYKPALKLNLRGGTKRGGHPGLKAVLRPRPGDANLSYAQATLPRSAFLDQAHIRTICTRVQFAAEQCPKGSIYGFAKAWTPLLDEPFEGPVILRSSNNKLPDLVLALKGLVDVNVSSRIDSKNGGIRNTFDVVPDAPVSKFVLELQGGKKGLIINSRDLCEGRTSRADIRLVAHNGRVANLRSKLQPQCGGKRKKR